MAAGDGTRTVPWYDEDYPDCNIHLGFGRAANAESLENTLGCRRLAPSMLWKPAYKVRSPTKATFQSVGYGGLP